MTWVQTIAAYIVMAWSFPLWVLAGALAYVMYRGTRDGAGMAAMAFFAGAASLLVYGGWRTLP